jgi:NADH-quinone oxidoreductase subunit I
MGSHGHAHEHKEEKKGVTVIVVERPQSLAQQSFLPAVIEGLGVTMRHFFKNTFKREYTQTLQYPEQKMTYPERYRGLHRLMTRDDGQVRCVACMLCPTICPAHCITIVPEETGDSTTEKRPRIFEIDELRCVVCGLCVEACPCDAIRMDTGVHMVPVYDRGDAVLGKSDLLKRTALSSAHQGHAAVTDRVVSLGGKAPEGGGGHHH